jgi:hypothetical protein
MKASGHAHWFERLLVELNFELWIGARRDPYEASAQVEESWGSQRICGEVPLSYINVAGLPK